MFDIGFWELALIGVVALLVVGPERLPALARTLGLWMGRLRRFLSQVKDDVDRELRADELKRMLDKPKGLDDVYDVLDDTRNTVNKAARDLRESADKPRSGKPSAAAPAPAPAQAEPEPAAPSDEERPAEQEPRQR